MHKRLRVEVYGFIGFSIVVACMRMHLLEGSTLKTMSLHILASQHMLNLATECHKKLQKNSSYGVGLLAYLKKMAGNGF